MRKLRESVPFLRRGRERHGFGTNRSHGIGRLAFVLLGPFVPFYPGPRISGHGRHLAILWRMDHAVCFEGVANSQ